jgi:hypothetical protein
MMKERGERNGRYSKQKACFKTKFQPAKAFFTFESEKVAQANQVRYLK